LVGGQKGKKTVIEPDTRGRQLGIASLSIGVKEKGKRKLNARIEGFERRSKGKGAPWIGRKGQEGMEEIRQGIWG